MPRSPPCRSWQRQRKQVHIIISDLDNLDWYLMVKQLCYFSLMCVPMSDLCFLSLFCVHQREARSPERDSAWCREEEERGTYTHTHTNILLSFQLLNYLCDGLMHLLVLDSHFLHPPSQCRQELLSSTPLCEAVTECRKLLKDFERSRNKAENIQIGWDYVLLLASTVLHQHPTCTR